MYAQMLHPGNAVLIELLSGGGSANPPGTVCDHCAKPATAVRASDARLQRLPSRALLQLRLPGGSLERSQDGV